MIKLFYKLFNHDKIDDMQRTIDIYKERNSQLEKENMEYKGYKLKYEVTKLYVEDDEALMELFDVARKHDVEMSNRQSGKNQLMGMQAAQQHGLGGLAYAGFAAMQAASRQAGYGKP